MKFLSVSRSYLTFRRLLLMIFLLGIIAAILYPYYARYLMRTKRVEAVQGLLETKKQLDKQYRETGKYNVNLVQLPKTGVYYFSIKGTDQTFEITAVVPNAYDNVCAVLTVDQDGKRGPVEHPECWENPP